MKAFYRFILGSLLLLSAFSAGAKGSFAIVIDPASYRAARVEVDTYASAIREADGYKVLVIEDVWGVPDSLRAVLRDLRFSRRDPLVGAVFVGDIPVPMIRGAQFLSSAFKMNEARFPREESSIPSDRYYDDFSLAFDYLGHDEGTPLFYYRLNASGAQTLSPDLFTGRIRPVDAGGKVRVDALKSFLLKAAEARLHPPVMDQLLFFSGHGYISESKTARLDEKRVWLEHFPLLDDGRNHISYIDYSDVVPVKQHLMNEMMRPDLNVAMLHHHGAPDTEYLSAIANPEMVADSLGKASLDLHLEDFKGYGYKPSAHLVVLDACYNGSFQLDDCIADEYIFQDGRTVAVQANSVNSLQDKWADRFFGIVAAGGCAGDLVRYAPYLESHLIGDPTFRFAFSGKNLDELIVEDRPAQWKKLLRKGTPDQQALALEQLFRKGMLSTERVLEIYKTSAYAVVRLEALYCLSRTGGDRFIDAVILAMDDADEFIRRMAVKLAGKSGDPRLIPGVVKVYLTNNATARVHFNAGYALIAFSKEGLMREFDKQLSEAVMVRPQEEGARLRESFVRSANRFTEDETSNIRQTRLYLYYEHVPALLDHLRSCGDPAVQVSVLEALGWHRLAWNAAEIAEVARQMSQDETLPEEVREEALKTYKRLGR
jgi:hypothetical protein